MDVIIIFGTIPSLWPLFRVMRYHIEWRYAYPSRSYILRRGDPGEDGYAETTLYDEHVSGTLPGGCTQASLGTSWSGNRLNGQPNQAFRVIGNEGASGFAVQVTAPLDYPAKLPPAQTRGQNADEEMGLELERRVLGAKSSRKQYGNLGRGDNNPKNDRSRRHGHRKGLNGENLHRHTGSGSGSNDQHHQHHQADRVMTRPATGPLTRMLQDIDNLQTWHSRAVSAGSSRVGVNDDDDNTKRDYDDNDERFKKPTGTFP